MATHQARLSFDRPLIAAIIPGLDVPKYTEADLALARSQAYHEGYDAARAFSDAQLAEFREEVTGLQHGLFHSLPNLQESMLQQLRIGLPALAVDIARRLLADFEPPAELVSKICVEALDQLFPERENLELIVSPRDAEILMKNMPDLEARYPGLRLRSDAMLRPGDCQVRSRFGVTDARLEAKLAAIQHELSVS